MEKCYKIITIDQAEDILDENDLGLADDTFQLKTNYAYMYNLGEKWLLVPNLFNGDCILFENFECYDSFYQKDSFPVENIEKDVFEYEDSEIIKRIDIHYQKYVEYFKKELNDASIVIDEKSMKKCFLYMKEKDSNYELESKDAIAFTGVLGEYFRRVKGGKWAYVKRYGDIIHTMNLIFTLEVNWDRSIITYLAFSSMKTNSKGLWITS